MLYKISNAWGHVISVFWFDRDIYVFYWGGARISYLRVGVAVSCVAFTVITLPRHRHDVTMIKWYEKGSQITFALIQSFSSI